MLGAILLGCFWLQLISLSSVIVLQPPHLCKGWGGHPLSDWGQSSTDRSPLALWLYSSVQYSVPQFSISHSSVRHYSEQSLTVVAFPCFTVAKSFMSWYALLLLFFLRFSSISLRCSPIQFFLSSFSCISWCCSLPPRREAGDVWCLPPVWNLRAVIWFHFAISSLVLLPTPVTLSVLSFSACWPFLLNFFQKILQYFSLRHRLFCMAPC